MQQELSPEQRDAQQAFGAFTDQFVTPHADAFDRQQAVPRKLIDALAQRGYLAAMLPTAVGGQGLDRVTYGLLNEELGRGSASVRSLLTVHDMVAQAVWRCGTESQRDAWLPRLARGEAIGAFALTEPEVGSDAKSVTSTAAVADGAIALNGRKKWISFGQVADVFLVFARLDDKLSAFLVPSDSPGLRVEPITDMLGLRAAMLAEVHLEDCRVPEDHLLGRKGFGLVSVAATALDLGRYSVACGCVGMGEACLQACLQHTSRRKQFGVYLKEHQLVRRMITDMLVQTRAARLLCRQAGRLADAGDPEAVMSTLLAKYYASTMVSRAAADAVQIHGAVGCSAESPVQRYYRDAKIMEIIEGSTQVLQTHLANFAYRGVS